MSGKRASDRKHPYITRVEGECNPHWWVRVQRMVDGARICIINMRFYDSDHGSRTTTLKAAIAYRDDKLAAVPKRQNHARPPGHGYVRETTIGGRPAWEGWVRLEGMRCSRTKNFIDVWGARVAKRRSLEWLERHRAAIAERAARAQRSRGSARRAA